MNIKHYYRYIDDKGLYYGLFCVQLKQDGFYYWDVNEESEKVGPFDSVEDAVNDARS